MSTDIVDVKFNKGSVVRLKSGSPAMTVASISDEWINTYWFHNGELRQGKFPYETVKDSEEYVPDARGRYER